MHKIMMSHDEIMEINSQVRNTFDLFDIHNYFEFEGLIFVGQAHFVAVRYIKENPSDSLFVWLQKNYSFTPAPPRN